MSRKRAHRRAAGSPRHRAKPKRSTAAGGASLWMGTVIFGSSTVALLAVLSRHHHTKFSALAALLSLGFVVSLIPAGVQLRSASLVADGRPLPKLTLGQAVVVGALSLAIAPLLAYLLHVPVAASALVSIQMLIFIPLAAKQGGLLAKQRFRPLGKNLVLEGVARFIMGAVGGLTLGVTGLAAGLCIGTIVALIALPYPQSEKKAQDRPRTSLVDTSLSLALLGLYVQFDVLIAPSVLARGGATTYDLAAVPSKGVYLVLLAAGPLLFPFVRRGGGRRRLVVGACVVSFAVGLVFTALLIAAVLGQPKAGFATFGLLGVAMTLAGLTGIVISTGVARGVSRPWPPMVLGLAVLLFSWPFRPTVTEFAVIVAGSHATTASYSMAIFLWGRRRGLEVGPSSLRDVERLAKAGDPLARLQDKPGGPGPKRGRRVRRLPTLPTRIQSGPPGSAEPGG
jgi:hypothetical protein